MKKSNLVWRKNPWRTVRFINLNNRLENRVPCSHSLTLICGQFLADFLGKKRQNCYSTFSTIDITTKKLWDSDFTVHNFRNRTKTKRRQKKQISVFESFAPISGWKWFSTARKENKKNSYDNSKEEKTRFEICRRGCLKEKFFDCVFNMIALSDNFTTRKERQESAFRLENWRTMLKNTNFTTEILNFIR